MRFRIFGPFEIARGSNGLVDFSATQKKTFWKAIEVSHPGLSTACGCYVVAAAGGSGSLPHYVGLTMRRTFAAECLAPHVRSHFNEVIADKPRLKPQLFLVAKLTPKNRFAKPSVSGHDDITFLEGYMIALALDRNPKLRNQKQTRYLKDLQVEGFLNSGSGKPGPSARKLRAVLGRNGGRRK
jgi:hypothetical protein